MAQAEKAVICDHRLEIAYLGIGLHIEGWKCKCGRVVKSARQLESEKALKLL